MCWSPQAGRRPHGICTPTSQSLCVSRKSAASEELTLQTHRPSVFRADVFCVLAERIQEEEPGFISGRLSGPRTGRQAAGQVLLTRQLPRIRVLFSEFHPSLPETT